MKVEDFKTDKQVDFGSCEGCYFVNQSDNYCISETNLVGMLDKKHGDCCGVHIYVLKDGVCNSK